MAARLSLLVLLCSFGCDQATPTPPSAADAPFLHDEAFLHGFKELAPDARQLYDPIAVLVMKPNQRWRVIWEEHPKGRFRRATNGRGFNEYEETSLEKHGLRVLVSGDSHTQGVVANEETFADVLERLLRDTGRAGAEVLNAGVGYTSPHCYLGMLHRHLDLAPDVFVATLFSGNDFMDDLRVAYLLHLAEGPRPDEAYYTPLNEAKSDWEPFCWQGVNQVYRFKHFPQEYARALEAVERSFAGMQALCAAHGIRFLAVILPTKYDVDLSDQREEFAELARFLDLTDEDMRTNERLAADLIARLAARGIDCLDATPAFRAEEAPLYWRRDHHLNVSGHAKLAELLLAKLQEMLPPP